MKDVRIYNKHEYSIKDKDVSIGRKSRRTVKCKEKGSETRIGVEVGGSIHDMGCLLLSSSSYYHPPPPHHPPPHRREQGQRRPLLCHLLLGYDSLVLVMRT